MLSKASSRSGMRVMAESIRGETPRPKSPHMNNEEPIELAHFPDAKKPRPGEKPKIERDDFPAPAFPYSDPERRKRYSDSYKGMSDDEEDQVDANDKENEDAKLKVIRWFVLHAKHFHQSLFQKSLGWTTSKYECNVINQKKCYM